MLPVNETPEQSARRKIDQMLIDAGWIIQNKNQINLSSGLGIVIREFQTDAGPADYILIVDRKPCGVIEAKREEEGHKLTAHENLSLKSHKDQQCLI